MEQAEQRYFYYRKIGGGLVSSSESIPNKSKYSQEL
jgi:hypothetical protein